MRTDAIGTRDRGEKFWLGRGLGGVNDCDYESWGCGGWGVAVSEWEGSGCGS